MTNEKQIETEILMNQFYNLNQKIKTQKLSNLRRGIELMIWALGFIVFAFLMQPENIFKFKFIEISYVNLFLIISFFLCCAGSYFMLSTYYLDVEMKNKFFLSELKNSSKYLIVDNIKLEKITKNKDVYILGEEEKDIEYQYFVNIYKNKYEITKELFDTWSKNEDFKYHILEKNLFLKKEE